MKLLVVTREFPPDVIGGMGYHLGYLYSEIAEMGHDITVLAGKCSQSTKTARELVPNSITVERFSYGTFHAHHLWFPIALRNCLRDIELDDFDVALTHTHIPFDLGIPTIQKYHGCSREQRPFFRKQLSNSKKVIDSLIDPTRRLIEQRSLRYIDFAFFNSELCRNAWKEHYEVESPTTVIHNGVDTEKFYPRDVEETEEYVLFVGDSVRKGLPTVKKYADKLSEDVWVVGPSEIEDTNITALGQVTQNRLAEFYTGAVATVHPARFEAFGNIILESLACGTPVVVSEHCGAAEIVDDSCGRVTDDLINGVNSIKGANHKTCVQKARKFTWSKVANQTIREIRTNAIVA